MNQADILDMGWSELQNGSRLFGLPHNKKIHWADGFEAKAQLKPDPPGPFLEEWISLKANPYRSKRKTNLHTPFKDDVFLNFWTIFMQSISKHFVAPHQAHFGA